MMATDNPAKNGDGRRSNDEAELRMKAVKRSWICPGAGFAFVGNRTYAILTFVASLCILPAVAWLAFQPTTTSLWTTVAVLVIGTVLWLGEQVSIKKTSPLRAPSPSFLDRGFVVSTCVIGLAAVLAIGLLVTAFGSLKMTGPGMAPTLEIAERLIYHKRVDWASVEPGAIIVHKNADDSGWGQPGWLLITRILAGPGDDISIRGGRYVVNGTIGPPVAGTGRYAVVLDIPSSPGSLKVPDDCYFMVQDSPTGGFDSRVLSWVRADDIVSSRVWYLSRRGIWRPVE